MNIKLDGTPIYDLEELGSHGAGAGLTYPEGISEISPLQYTLYLDYESGGGIGGVEEKWDEENGIVTISGGFAQVIDVEKLETVHFGNVDAWLTVR